MNIPIFRSYELDTAFLIEGSYIKENGFYMNNTIPDYDKPVVRHKICDEDGIYHEVSKDYLAINFPDMLDSKGNKIFASLSEDGKGGDKMLKGVDMEQYGLKNTYYTAICIKGSVLLQELSESTSISFTAHGFLTELKVIGVQE